MLSGSAEPECRERPLLQVSSALSGADKLADDAPGAEATIVMTHATIHLTVFGTATAGCLAGSTAKN